MSGRGNPVEVQKCRATLLNLLKQPENNTCADCGRKQPTWASTNIGVFVCIGCSGIHRNLGTHISKVKSVNLDSWNYRLVNHFKRQGGNETVNSHYECNLPASLKPDVGATSHQMEGFIRNKYQHRKWYSETPREKREVPSRKKRSDREARRKKRRQGRRSDTSDTNPSDSPPTTTTKTTPKEVVAERQPKKPVVVPEEQQELPDLLDVASLQPKDDLLSFETTIVQQQTPVQTQQQQQQPSTTTSSFGFITPSSTTNAASNGNAFGFTTNDVAAQPSLTAQQPQPGFDFSVPVEDSKSSILSKYHEDPFRAQSGVGGSGPQPRMSTEFLTQLNTPVQQSPMHRQQPPAPVAYGVMGMQAMGMGMGMGQGMQGFGANPYTMLNQQQPPRNSQPYGGHGAAGFGFR